MGTNTRIRSMALAALLAACGGGDGTECGPGTIEEDGQCRPAVGEGEAEAESEAESEAGCGDEWTVCAVDEQCWSLWSYGRVPPTMREVCGPPNPFIGALSGRWLLVEQVEDDRGPRPTNDLTVNVQVNPGSDCNCSKQAPGDACVDFTGVNKMILSGSSLHATGFNSPSTASCHTAGFAADIEGQVLQDGQRVEYTARYVAKGTVTRRTWEKQ